MPLVYLLASPLSRWGRGVLGAFTIQGSQYGLVNKALRGRCMDSCCQTSHGAMTLAIPGLSKTKLSRRYVFIKGGSCELGPIAVAELQSFAKPERFRDLDPLVIGFRQAVAILPFDEVWLGRH